MKNYDEMRRNLIASYYSCLYYPELQHAQSSSCGELGHPIRWQCYNFASGCREEMKLSRQGRQQITPHLMCCFLDLNSHLLSSIHFSLSIADRSTPEFATRFAVAIFWASPLLFSVLPFQCHLWHHFTFWLRSPLQIRLINVLEEIRLCWYP